MSVVIECGLISFVVLKSHMQQYIKYTKVDLYNIQLNRETPYGPNNYRTTWHVLLGNNNTFYWSLCHDELSTTIMIQV